MVQPLPGFLHLSLNVCSPSQVLGDVYTEVLEATHPLHRGPTDHKRSVGLLLSLPEVHDQLLSFAHVQRQLSWHHDVSLSTSSKYAASSSLLMRPRTTVSSANSRVSLSFTLGVSIEFPWAFLSWVSKRAWLVPRSLPLTLMRPWLVPWLIPVPSRWALTSTRSIPAAIPLFRSGASVWVSFFVGWGCIPLSVAAWLCLALGAL